MAPILEVRFATFSCGFQCPCLCFRALLLCFPSSIAPSPCPRYGMFNTNTNIGMNTNRLLQNRIPLTKSDWIFRIITCLRCRTIKGEGPSASFKAVSPASYGCMHETITKIIKVVGSILSSTFQLISCTEKK